MNPKEQADQLRLAAGILETGHPWEYRTRKDSEWTSSRAISPTYVFTYQQGEIRIILATPPDGRPLHNPDNLTAEQVGVGYRLLLADEVDNEQHEGSGDWLWMHLEFFSNYNRRGWRTGRWTWDKSSTIRLPLSVPWPALPDPYAELKAAHAAGKVIQVKDSRSGEWCPAKLNHNWTFPVDQYRAVEPEPEPAETEPATKTVDLGPEDVPPGSVLRLSTWDVGIHVTPSVWRSSVSFVTAESVTRRAYEDLRVEGWQINRSIPLTGKWNPDAWEACSKHQ